MTVEHTVGFGDGFVLVSLADLKYTDEFALANDLDPNLFQEGFAKIDLRFVLGNRGRTWTLALLARNVTNRLTSNFGNDIPLFPRAYFKFADRLRSLSMQAQWFF